MITPKPLRPRGSKHHQSLVSAFEMQRETFTRGAHGWYVTMLADDLHKMHFAYRPHIEYTGVDHSRGEEIVNRLLLEFRQMYRLDALDQVFQLASVVASDYLSHGTSVCELFEDDDEGTSVARLGHLPPWSLKRRGRKVFQVAPTSGKIEWVELSSESIVKFPLPGRLGKDLHKTARRLQVLGAHRLASPDSLFKMRKVDYEFAVHKGLIDEMLAQATSDVGWDGRELFLDRASNSYRTYRRLKFRRTWLLIVDSVSATLNSLLRHPSVNSGAEMTVHIEGLPEIEAVEQAMSSVIDGSQSLDEIFRRLLHPRTS